MTDRETACWYQELERKSTQELDEMLYEELQREYPDENVVLPILHILEERESEVPVQTGEGKETGWERFQRDNQPREPEHKAGKWIARVAVAAAAVFLLILAIPRPAGADNVFDVLLRVTESVLQFFSSEDDPDDIQREYVFQTDNPGLQQLYDKVTELGVTDPVVPMWLPDGGELVELKESTTYDGTKVSAIFAYSDNSVVITIRIIKEELANQFEKTTNQVEAYEVAGVSHAIVVNEDTHVVTWKRDGVVCSLVVDLEKDDLYTIIKSIYRRHSE